MAGAPPVRAVGDALAGGKDAERPKPIALLLDGGGLGGGVASERRPQLQVGANLDLHVISLRRHHPGLPPSRRKKPLAVPRLVVPERL